MMFFETSAKENLQISESFGQLIELVLQGLINEDEKNEKLFLNRIQESTVKIQEIQKVEKKCC